MEAPSSSALLLGSSTPGGEGWPCTVQAGPPAACFSGCLRAAALTGIYCPQSPSEPRGRERYGNAEHRASCPPPGPGRAVCMAGASVDTAGCRHHHSSSGPQSLSSHREEGAWIPRHWLQRRPRVLGRSSGPWGAGLDLPPPQSEARKPERRWDSSA